MAVAIDALDELRAQLRDAVAQPGLTVQDRMFKLRSLRDDLTDLLGACDTYMADMELEREGEFSEMQESVAFVRANADMREAAISRGIATVEEMDALGFLSHAELDALTEEGRLFEAAGALKKFTEKLHRRDRHGKFADKPGSMPNVPRARGGGSTPKVLHTHADGPVKTRQKQRDEQERVEQEREAETNARLDTNISKHKGKFFPVGKDGMGRVEAEQPPESTGYTNVTLTKVPSDPDYAEYDDGDSIVMPTRDVLAAIRKEERELEGEGKDPRQRKRGPTSLASKEFREQTQEGIEPPFEMVLSAPITPRLYDMSLERGDDPEVVQRNLKLVEEIGLNDWPEKGELATQILGDAKDTEEKFTISVPGHPEPVLVWTPEREALHDQIIGALLRRRKLNENGEPAILDPEGDELAAPEGTPRALFMGGGTASGKTTALRLAENQDVQPEDAAIIDPDEIKGMLPEYKAMVEGGERYAASGVHEESSYLAKRLQREAVARGLNVIVDGTGDSQIKNPDDEAEANKLRNKMRVFKDAGYQVSAFYVNAPVDVALVRATGRAMHTGRWVPKPEIESIHKGVSQRFQTEVLSAVEEGLLSDLRGYHNIGETPTKMFHLDENGKFVVLEQEIYDAFIEKATAA